MDDNADAVAENPDSPDAGLRAARRERVFGVMDEAGLDVLVLGRRASVAYATGAQSLWTAGTRPFGAACVLVRDRRAVHLVSTWDAGVPPEVPFEHLYGITWNPAVMAEVMRGIAGFTAARRIGTDSLSPGFTRAARRLAPHAELVPADDLLQAAWAVKLPAELARIGAAVAVARAGVDAATAALARGATTQQALAAALRAVARQGATVSASAPVVQPVDAAGTRVHVDLNLLVDGYEGGLGRTVSRDGSPSTARSDLAATGEQPRLRHSSPAAPGDEGISARQPVDRSGDPSRLGTEPAEDGEAHGAPAPVAASDSGSTESQAAVTGEHAPRGEASPEAVGGEGVAALQRRVLEACRAGATAGDLRAAAAGADSWMVRGSGMGFEAPVVSDTVGERAVLRAGMVLSVEVALDGWWRRDLAAVGPTDAEVL